MNAALWLAAGLACAQLGSSGEQATRAPTQDTRTPADSGPPPRPVASRITDVTVYQGQALVTREVNVPEGGGTLELLVSPLPSQTEDSSLYTEGAEGMRVLTTRFRSNAVKDDTRQEVRLTCRAKRRSMWAATSWAGCGCRSSPPVSRSSPGLVWIRSFR